MANQPDRDIAVLELRHRQRGRVEDRIRAAKATGLGNLWPWRPGRVPGLPLYHRTCDTDRATAHRACMSSG